MSTLTHSLTLSRKDAAGHTPSARPKPRLASSAQWVDYFRANAAKESGVPWELGATGCGRNLAAIAPSLRAWQLGETSDGRHLLAAARDYAAREADPTFLEAVRLFIREEQRHGAELGRWLDLAGIPRARRDWGDTLFRAFRYALPNIECWATPVVMVETHAMIYYHAIRRATGSPVLQAICARILADEVPHIRFQCERLARVLHHRSLVLRTVTLLLHRIFFAGITLAVWSAHRRALTAGGYPFRKFWRTAWTRMRHAWRTINPRHYDWSRRPH